MKTDMNMQDIYLNNIRKNKLIVTIYLTGDTRLTGKIVGFDSFTLVLDVGGTQKLVYKNSILYISPNSSRGNVIFKHIR